jgi:putative spermidine/putrescine transport system substrate-binding protein
MKKYLSVFLLCVVVGSLLFAGGAKEQKKPDYMRLSWDRLVEEAKKEASLRFAHWRAESFWEDTAAGFKSKYGIEVKIEKSDADSLLKKIIGEKDKEEGSVDVVLVGDRMVKPAMGEGLFYGPLTDRIPHGTKLDTKLGNVQADTRTNGYLIPLYRSQMGLLYDPQKVESPPQTWFELIEWIGKNPLGQFAFSDPEKGSSGQAIIQAVLANLSGGLDKYRGDTSVVESKVEGWKETWQILKEYRDMVSITSSNDLAIAKLSRGEVSLAVASDVDTRKALQSGSLPDRTRLYVPKMGLPCDGDTLGVPKNSKNKAAAILFVAYLTDTDAQIQMSDKTGKSIARTDVQAKPAVLTEDQRRKYGVPWMPEAYRKRFTDEFAANVLAP